MEDKKQDIPQIELLTPLTGNFFPDNAGYEYDEEMDELYGLPLDGEGLVQYESAIHAMVSRYSRIRQDNYMSCDLMEYFRGSDSIKEKVSSAVVSVKNMDGVLYGCTTLTLQEFLEAPELQEVCEYITGQYADGWGEVFEQRDIQVDGGYLNVHFYQHEDFRIQKKVRAEPEKMVSERDRPKMKLLGHDGNIYFIMADARKLLIRNGQEKEAEEMYDRVQKSGDYNKALGIISEYVETELSPPQKPGRRKTKTEKEECR